MLIDDLATKFDRPAHDHWTISASFGQHTSHYWPVMIAPFLDIDRDGALKKCLSSVRLGALIINHQSMSVPLMLAWVFFIAVLGVTMAIPMKRQMINIEQLRFP